MPTDWDLPLLSSVYADFLDYLKARDSDVATMFLTTPTNPIVGTVRYNRSTNTLQEWSGSVWNNLPIAVVGGGTGAITASDARTNLGLGTMAVQNANNITVTGGTASNLGALTVNGNASVVGNIAAGGLVSTGHVSAPTSIFGTLLTTTFGAELRGGGAYTLTGLDYTYVCTGGSVVLPTAVGIRGRIYVIKRVGTLVTITSAGGVIDGIASYILQTNYESAAFQSDGQNWNVIYSSGRGMSPDIYWVENNQLMDNVGNPPFPHYVNIGGTANSAKWYFVLLYSNIGSLDISLYNSNTQLKIEGAFASYPVQAEFRGFLLSFPS